jgi:hypothetical protein
MSSGPSVWIIVGWPEPVRQNFQGTAFRQSCCGPSVKDGRTFDVELHLERDESSGLARLLSGSFGIW